MNKNKLKELLLKSEIHEIRDKLLEIAFTDKELKSFNHRNAWLSESLNQIFTEHGFKIVSIDKLAIKDIIGSTIGDFQKAYSWSRFILASKL